MRDALRYLWMPGSDIFTRRRTYLRSWWASGDREVLDAGFGNGWFSYQACRSGARVVAISNHPELERKARDFYNGYLGVDEGRLTFCTMNLYDLGELKRRFDEIICYETLEHIRDDDRICRGFHDALKPGGVLHLCCPNAEHPRWQAEKLDQNEAGGHVRHGYTLEGYRRLLEPIGFEIGAHEGVGGPALVFMQEKVQRTLRRFAGEFGAYLVTLLSLPMIRFDSRRPALPFSVYVKAVKHR